MLAGTGLCDDAFLAHKLGEQRLSEGIVDLMRTGMQQVLTLEEYLRPPIMFCQFFRIVKIGWPTGIFLKQALELCLKFRIIFFFFLSGFQFVKCRHDDFRNILSAILAKSAFCIHSIILLFI